MGDDRRRTSLKLTEEAFAYLEEEQEKRAVSTRQDTVEAVIQEHMELTADDDVRSARERWKADLRENAGTYGLIGAAVAALSSGSVVALLLAGVIITVAVAGIYLEYKAFIATREDDDDADDGGDTPATEPAAD